jgi:hypothetical protein
VKHVRRFGPHLKKVKKEKKRIRKSGEEKKEKMNLEKMEMIKERSRGKAVLYGKVKWLKMK